MLCHEYALEHHQKTIVPDQLREPFPEGHQFLFDSTSAFLVDLIVRVHQHQDFVLKESPLEKNVLEMLELYW